MAIKTVTPQELKERLARREIMLIDVREPEEYAAIHIEGACLIPLATVALDQLPTQNQELVFHCRSGKRSEEACKKVLAQNPQLKVYNLEGGIMAWKQAGFPTQPVP